MYTDWNRQWPPNNSQWRHPGNPGRPRAPFRGQYQRFNHPRPNFAPRPQFQPRNDNYWCETCDRGFATEDILTKHMQQHQKCNIDGCQFIAHPKVITKHIQMQHSSGLYKKIANIHKPEEIEKWREERRKKYPTKVNIDKKAAELKEKIDRGEKMGLDRKRTHPNKYDRDNKPGQDFKRRNCTGNENQPRSKFNRNNNHNRKRPARADPKVLPAVEDERKLKPFAGISVIQMDSADEVEDISEGNNLIEIDDDLELNSENIKPEENTGPVVCGALSSLICDYGSTDDEEDIEKNTLNDEKVGLSVNVNSKASNKGAIHNSSKVQKDFKSIMAQPSVILNVKTMNHIHNQDSRGKDETENTKCLDARQSNSIFKDTAQKVCEENEISSSDVLKPICDSIEGRSKPVIKENETSIQQMDDEDSGPEETRVVKKEDTTPIPLEEPKPKNVVVRKKNVSEKRQQFRRPKPKGPSTLLEKLLFKEVRQERNFVLQCIRYIRRNNNFDKKE